MWKAILWTPSKQVCGDTYSDWTNSSDREICELQFNYGIISIVFGYLPNERHFDERGVRSAASKDTKRTEDTDFYCSWFGWGASLSAPEDANDEEVPK